MYIEVNRDLDKFKDINYITSNHEEREDIIEEYCKLLNTFDCRFKVTIANENNGNKGRATWLNIDECHVLLKQSNIDSVRLSETSGVSDPDT